MPGRFGRRSRASVDGKVLVLAAAKIKADFPMAYADALAVATAIREDAVVVTGDPEFAAVEHLVQIDWL